MPTIFENISDGFYTAFFEPNHEKRKAAIEVWIKEATPLIQSAVENEIRTYLESILEQTWTQEGWKSRVEKFTRLAGNKRFFETYRLYLDIKIRQRERHNNEVTVGLLSSEVRVKTLEAAKACITWFEIS
jgi:hypothetical protein